MKRGISILIGSALLAGCISNSVRPPVPADHPSKNTFAGLFVCDKRGYIPADDLKALTFYYYELLNKEFAVDTADVMRYTGTAVPEVIKYFEANPAVVAAICGSYVEHAPVAKRYLQSVAEMRGNSQNTFISLMNSISKTRITPQQQTQSGYISIPSPSGEPENNNTRTGVMVNSESGWDMYNCRKTNGTVFCN